MARPRKDKNSAWMPPRVYRSKTGAYEWHPANGGSITIAKKTATQAEVWKAYENAQRENRPNGIEYLAKLYHEGERFKELAQTTKDDYLGYASKKPIAAFRQADTTLVRAHHIRAYMDERAKTSKYRANRELAWMSNVFAHAFERGLVPVNPCKGVKPFKEQKRQHYVTDADYQVVFKEASLPVQVAMELAYLTGLRQKDLLNMQWSQVKTDGIHVRQSKTKAYLIKEITPRVKSAIDAAKRLHKGVISGYVLHNRWGHQYTRSGFDTLWRRAMTALPKEKRFRFHDLRKKGATDFQGETKSFTGHKTESMAKLYNLAPLKSPSLK